MLPRYAVKLPYVLPTPESFDPGRPEAWPKVEGRIEFVEGRLLYMPPCGDEQQGVAVDVVTELNLWRRDHAQFFVGANEAGMMLGGDVRGADAAVWRATEVRPFTGGFPRKPPVLAVEVAGKDDTLEMLADKAEWYLRKGVEVVWVVIPAERTVRVITRAGMTEHGQDDRLPGHPALPGLTPEVADFFRQLPERRI